MLAECLVVLWHSSQRSSWMHLVTISFCFTDGLYLPFALFIIFLRTLIARFKNENKEQKWQWNSFRLQVVTCLQNFLWNWAASDYCKSCNITLISNYGLKFQQYVIISEQLTQFSQVSLLSTVANLANQLTKKTQTKQQQQKMDSWHSPAWLFHTPDYSRREVPATVGAVPQANLPGPLPSMQIIPSDISLTGLRSPDWLQQISKSQAALVLLRSKHWALDPKYSVFKNVVELGFKPLTFLPISNVIQISVNFLICCSHSHRILLEAEYREDCNKINWGNFWTWHFQEDLRGQIRWWGHHHNINLFLPCICKSAEFSLPRL